MSREVIDEDVCADCAHLCLLRPPVGYPSFRSPEQGGPWRAPGLCVRGWPITDTYMGIATSCGKYEQATKEGERT
jgi:hypothetical protein